MSKNTTPALYEDYSDHFTPLQVEVSHFEDSLRYFKSLVQKDKILSAFRDKQSYEKPSEKKRRKKREAAERRRITNIRDRMMATGEWDRIQKQKDKKRDNKVSRYKRDAENELE
jgi:small subunit ribosomal protein S21